MPQPSYKAWLEISRPLNVVLGGITCYLGGYIAGIDDSTYISLILSTCSVMLFMAAGNIVNDIMDSAIDAQAHPSRPIPSGRIDRSLAKGVAGSIWIVSLLLMGVSANLLKDTMELWWGAIIIWGIAAILMLSYDLGPRTKQRGLIGNIVISLMVGIVIIFGAASVGMVYLPLIWLVGATSFFINLAREIVKDCEDMESDSKTRNTLPMAVGKQKARMVAYSISMGGVVCAALPYYLGYFNLGFLLFQLPAVLLILTCNGKMMAGDDKSCQLQLRQGLIMGLLGFSASVGFS
ncbi:geranylgeranylglycerol-phosphate geranylgeranyltransferase [Deltaproteobacteria bacterium]|nr:geranylgeranylglycerol-phosphate geranylgeranyltransferase [Deltaproteobacteria bacterium]